MRQKTSRSERYPDMPASASSLKKQIPNFFVTVFNLCKSPKFVSELYDSSPIRAILRLLLLCLILNLLCSTIQTIVERIKAEPMLERFGNITGDIMIQPDKISFEKIPDQAKIFKFKDWKLGYYPNDTLTKENFYALTDSFSVNIVRDKVIFLKELSDDDAENGNWKHPYYAMMITANDILQNLNKNAGEPVSSPAPKAFKLSEKKDLWDVIQNSENTNLKETNENSNLTQNHSEESLSEGEHISVDKSEENSILIFEKDFFIVYYLIIYFFWMFSLFFGTALPLLAITIFFISIVQFLISGSRQNNITMKQSITATVYDSFPALVFAAFFSMLQLEWPSFTSAFFIVFLVYQFFSSAHILQKINGDDSSRTKE